MLLSDNNCEIAHFYHIEIYYLDDKVGDGWIAEIVHREKDGNFEIIDSRDPLTGHQPANGTYYRVLFHFEIFHLKFCPSPLQKWLVSAYAKIVFQLIKTWS